MGRARGVAPDAQRLTERTQRNPTNGTVVGDDLRAQQVLAGVGATYGHIEGMPCIIAARNTISHCVRRGRTNEEMEELLDACGLGWDDASPIPGNIPEPEPEAGPGEPVWNTTKDCTRCQQPKPLTDYPADAAKSDGHHSRCKTCQATSDAARKTPAAQPKELPTEQWCGTCKQTRPAASFGLDKQSPTGLARRCRTCKSRADKDTRTRRKQRTNQMERTNA